MHSCSICIGLIGLESSLCCPVSVSTFIQISLGVMDVPYLFHIQLISSVNTCSWEDKFLDTLTIQPFSICNHDPLFLHHLLPEGPSSPHFLVSSLLTAWNIIMRSFLSFPPVLSILVPLIFSVLTLQLHQTQHKFSYDCILPGFLKCFFL